MCVNTRYINSTRGTSFFFIKIYIQVGWRVACESVWPASKAGKQRDIGSDLLQLSFHFKGCSLWTLSCDFVPHNYETLKWLSSLPTLMQKSFRWWQCSDSYTVSLSPSAIPPSLSFSLSLISLVVSVDVKRHVYLPTQGVANSRWENSALRREILHKYVGAHVLETFTRSKGNMVLNVHRNYKAC